MAVEFDDYFADRAGDYGTTTCTECGAECLDPADGVGIHRGGAPICSDCAETGQ